MWPVSLDCPFLITPVVFTNLCPVSCGPNVASVTGLSLTFVLCHVPMWPVSWIPLWFWTLTWIVHSSLSCVMWTQCGQCHWIVHSSLPLWFSLTFVLCHVDPMWPVSLDCPFCITPVGFSNLCPVSCGTNVASVTGLSFITPVVFSVTGLSILHYPCGFSNLCPVSCGPNVASVTGLSILDYPCGFL